MLHGQTEVYVRLIGGGILRDVQLDCRRYEARGFEVLSLSFSDLADHWIITLRAPRTLFINFDVYATGELSHTRYQMGPYDGDFAASAALAQFEPPDYKPEDVHITAFRDHSRVFIGTPDADTRS